MEYKETPLKIKLLNATGISSFIVDKFVFARPNSSTISLICFRLHFLDPINTLSVPFHLNHFQVHPRLPNHLRSHRIRASLDPRRSFEENALNPIFPK